MRLLFLTDNFPPEVNAPASRTYEHCCEWVKAGLQVTVITSQPNFPLGKVFPGYRNRWYQCECLDGIKVIRVFTFIAPNEGFLLRIVDQVSFAISAFIVGLFCRTDLIVATSPQFFTACSGYLLSVCKARPWIFEVRDLWPESIKAVGVMRDSLALRLLEKLELCLYQRADRIVVVTDSFKERIAARGISSGKIDVIKNGVDTSRFLVKDKDLALINQLGLSEKFVVGYVGTHGMAHALDFILLCAQRIQQRAELGSIHFLFIGDGAQRQQLLQLSRDLGLLNVTMIPSVSKQEVVRYLSSIDIALVNLKRVNTFEAVIPSKIFESAAVEKPILLGVDGEARFLVEEYNAGIYFEPENSESFLQGLLRLYLDRNLMIELRAGCKDLACHYSRIMQAKLMLNVIKSASKAGSKVEILPSNTEG